VFGRVLLGAAAAESAEDGDGRNGQDGGEDTDQHAQAVAGVLEGRH